MAMDRREYLAAIGAIGLGSIAGCTEDTEGENEETTVSTTETTTAEPPSFTVVELPQNSKSIKETDTVSIGLTIKNEGGPGETTVEILGDGEVVDQQEISLATEEQTKVEYLVENKEPGEYNYVFTVQGTDIEEDISVSIITVEQALEQEVREKINADAQAETRGVNISGSSEEGFSVEADYTYSTGIFSSSAEEYESGVNETASDILNSIYQSTESISSVELEAYVETRDEYGNEGEAVLHTVVVSDETESKINWNNFDSDNLQLVADDYFFNDLIV